jgi:hypothetical protein
MKSAESIFTWFASPVLTRKRIWFAFIVALLTDAMQVGLGPLGWVVVDQGLDIIAMLLISGAIGFHMLLLPTFLIEFIPGPDMLPTWTGCTAAVVMLRKKARQPEPLQPRQPVPPPIDVASEVTRVPPGQVSRDENSQTAS